MLSARHMYLPFDLRLDPKAWSDKKNVALLKDLFPGDGIAFDGRCLIYWFTVLLPKPWPKTVAGVPCYFSLDFNDQGPIPRLVPAYWMSPCISPDIDGRNLADWDPVFVIVKDYFKEEEILITEVQYWGFFLMVILENRNADITKLPNRVANIRCYYLYEDEMGRPEVPQAHRLVEPTTGNPYENHYDMMRPGLRLASGYDPSQPGVYLRTYAGVLVRDQISNIFMTTSSHGFPNEWGTTVYHPSPAGGRIVGELIKEISHTDLALVKLRTNEQFVNIIFQSESVPKPIQLRQFVKAGYSKSGIVMLDSPDTGYIEGTLRISSLSRVLSDDPSELKQCWLRTTWFHTGQDSSQDLPDGMCGSAIWDEDGSVLGFFRYAPSRGIMKDWCSGIAADELIDRGYSLVDSTIK